MNQLGASVLLRSAGALPPPPNRGIKLTSHRPNMQTTKKEKDYASLLINKARRNLLWSNMLEMVTRRIIS